MSASCARPCRRPSRKTPSISSRPISSLRSSISALPAQIDVRTVGYDRATNLRVAQELRRRIAAIPGIADAHLQQETDAPSFYAMIDRTRAIELGLNATTVANNINISLSSSEQVSPNFWTDPK